MLLELFKELSLHPKNAAELKALILQLAVQGKLTAKWREENPDVEPASELLKRIEVEKERLVNAKKIKREGQLLPIEKKDLPFKVPTTWIWTKLGFISQIVGGGTPKSNNANYFTENGIPWFTPADLGRYKSKYVKKGQRDITELGLKNSSAQLMPAGSVLFSSRAPIGHTAICLNDFCTNQGFKSSVPFVKEMNEYIYYFFNSIVKDANEKASGTTFKEVSGTEVKNFLFPLPPLKEQYAIVSTVNQLFAEVEQLEQLTKERIQLKHDFAASALQRLVQAGNINGEWAAVQQHFHTFFNEKPNVKKLRETILQLAVQGKLTTHWRKENSGTEPATELLKRIIAEKQQLIQTGKIKKEKPLPPVKEEEIPFELPEGWVWCRLGSITSIKGGKRLPKGEKLLTDNTGRIYIRVTDMKNGTIDDSDLHFISEEVFQRIANYIIEKDDLYLTIVGATIGKLGLVPDKFHGMSLTENAARIIRYQIDSVFLYFSMISDLVQGQFFDKTNQVGVPKLALHRVAKTIIPLPPKEEQHAIVNTVNTLMGLCDLLEQKIGQQKSQVEELMRSCVREVVG